MSRLEEWIRIVVIAAVSLWAGFDFALKLLVVLCTFDIVSGVAASLIAGRGLSSDVAWPGILRKALMVVSALLVYWVGRQMGTPEAGTAVAAWWAGTEGLSILENLGRAGIPIPPALKDVLSRLRGGDSGSGEVG